MNKVIIKLMGLSFIAASLLVQIAHANSSNFFELVSPSGTNKVIVKSEPSPDSPDVFRMYYSLVNIETHKTTALGATEYPIIGIKWHANSNAFLVVEHISRQIVLRLGSKHAGEWSMNEVQQFESPLNYFKLINCRSEPTSFLLYYTGSDDKTSDNYICVLSKLEISSKKCNVVKQFKFKRDDLDFYHLSIDAGLSRGSGIGAQHYSPALSEAEPAWFRPSQSEDRQPVTPSDTPPLHSGEGKSGQLRQ